MKLLILHQAAVFGGAERTTSNLLTHLDRSVVRHITLAAPEALRRLLPANYDAYVDTAELIQNGWFTTPARVDQDIDATVRLLREVQPDIALGMMHYCGCLVALASARAGLATRTIASFRGPLWEHIRRYETVDNHIAFLYRIVAQATAAADRVLVPSQGTAADTCEHFQADVARTVVIPNGIDAAAVRAAAAAPADGLERVPEHLPILCTAARLSEEKNLDLLLAAVADVQKTRPCALLLVGDGPERSSLEHQVDVLGLTDQVLFVGHRDNVFPFMRAADIYIHTCEFEGFGYAMLEALACGTPVIATDCPHGPREVLADGESGVLVPPNDAAALAAAIVALLCDPARYAHLKTVGLRRSEELSVAKMVLGHQQVFAAVYNASCKTMSESEYIPYAAAAQVGTPPALVLAPHPDDEVLGCAGAIRAHVIAGHVVDVVIVTDGCQGIDDPRLTVEAIRQIRVDESTCAAEVLGYGRPDFWGYPDRGLICDEALIDRIVHHITAGGYRAVFAPSLLEIHPDHRALAQASLAAVARLNQPVDLCFYEVGQPLYPNRLLDLTPHVEIKRCAIACFGSQLDIQNYGIQNEGLNCFRSYTLPKAVSHAEAYFVVDAAEARDLAARLNRTGLLPLGRKDLEETMTQVDSTLTQKASNLKRATMDRDTMLRSRSWRLTAPLRRLYQWLR